MMVWYRFVPGWQILLLPLFVVLALLASLGPGLWITALNVKYRDFRYVIPFLVQFGLYVSPVGFSSSVVPEEWRCSTASTRWSASSTASAGAFSAARARSTGRASLSASASSPSSSGSASGASAHRAHASPI